MDMLLLALGPVVDCWWCKAIVCAQQVHQIHNEGTVMCTHFTNNALPCDGVTAMGSSAAVACCLTVVLQKS
jgi:hypothetical protein